MRYSFSNQQRLDNLFNSLWRFTKKEKIKTPHYWLFEREKRWIPLTEAVNAKWVFVMTSSCTLTDVVYLKSVLWLQRGYHNGLKYMLFFIGVCLQSLGEHVPRHLINEQKVPQWRLFGVCTDGIKWIMRTIQPQNKNTVHVLLCLDNGGLFQYHLGLLQVDQWWWIVPISPWVTPSRQMTLVYTYPYLPGLLH